MSIAGSIPAANLGTVDTGNKTPGIGTGIFEYTEVYGRSYVTKLTFKNVKVTLKHGANAGFVGVEMYDFGKGLMMFKGMNVAIAATQADALNSALSVLVGTVTGTDLATPGATEKNIIIVTSATGGTASTAGDVWSLNARTTAFSTTGGAQYIDGTATASKFFLNLNGTNSADSVLTLNGTVEFHYEDLGGDLAVAV